MQPRLRTSELEETRDRDTSQATGVNEKRSELSWGLRRKQIQNALKITIYTILSYN